MAETGFLAVRRCMASLLHVACADEGKQAG